MNKMKDGIFHFKLSLGILLGIVALLAGVMGFYYADMQARYDVSRHRVEYEQAAVYLGPIQSFRTSQAYVQLDNKELVSVVNLLNAFTPPLKAGECVLLTYVEYLQDGVMVKQATGLTRIQ